MGRLRIALFLVLAAPATAWAQTPDPAPGKDAKPAASAAASDSAAPGKTAPDKSGKAQPADASTSAASGKSADKAAPDATKPDNSPKPDSSAKPGAQPPPYYYVEPGTEGPPPPAPSGKATAPAEPPPPGFGPDIVYEPPPPPKPHHVAPKTSLWAGARVGWFVPFGNLWGTCTQSAAGQCQLYQGTKWSDYASSGPMFEIDAGARLARNYNLFVLWEHAALGNGKAEPHANGGQNGGSTDYYAIGARVSSDPDSIGFLTEVDIGYRRFHATWADGSELQLTNAPFEFRIGLGADIRISRTLTLSPMATIDAGGFGTVKRLGKGGVKQAVNPPVDETGGHAAATLQIGGHFDIAGSKD